MQTQHRQAGRYRGWRAILSLTSPRRGRVLHDGTDITHWPTRRIVGRDIACIPEGRKVFQKVTVHENPLMGAYRDAAGEKAEARLAGVFEALPRLKERVRQLAGTMSGGEQAILSIGRGLMAAPKLSSRQTRGPA